MKVPKTIRCEFIMTPAMAENRICHVDDQGWGECGDGVIDENGNLDCLWIEEVLDWQDIEKPACLKIEHYELM